MKSINVSMTNQGITASKHHTHKQQGYSIIELSIALAIISLILVGSLAGVQRVLRSNNVNKDLFSLNLIASKLSALNSQGLTTGVNMTQLNGVKVFEGLLVNVDANNVPTVNNAFGGNIVVASNTAVIGNYPIGSGFLIYSTNIPSAACPDLLNGLNSLSAQITTDNSNPKPAVAGAELGYVVKPAVNAPAAIPSANILAGCTPGSSQNGNVHIAAFIPKS